MIGITPRRDIPFGVSVFTQLFCIIVARLIWTGLQRKYFCKNIFLKVARLNATFLFFQPFVVRRTQRGLTERGCMGAKSH